MEMQNKGLDINEIQEISDAIMVSKSSELDSITEEQMATVPTEVIVEEKDVAVGIKGMPTSETVELKEADVSILDVMDGKDIDIDQDDVAKVVSDKMGISDEDALKIGQTIIKFRNGEKFNCYSELPESIQSLVKMAALQNGMGRESFNVIAAAMIQEIINEAELDKTFVDFDKSIANAIQMPSTEDIFQSSMSETFVDNINKQADIIRDESPEKADTLVKIGEAFTDALTLRPLFESYRNMSKVRKAVRRDVNKLNRYINEFNFRNEKSIFKMQDCNMMILGLRKSLIEDKNTLIFTEDENSENEEFIIPINDIDEIDIIKFMILFCKTAESYNANDTVDASYMYYSMKNVIALMQTAVAKTQYTVKLINNICDVIKMIRDFEEEETNNVQTGARSIKHGNKH